MSRIKFVHAADLHLDSPFHGIASEMPEYVVNTLRQATFEAYGNIIELCLREQVDALLVAGDIYDGADRSLRAQLKFVEGLHRLDASGVRTFICHGNHDPLDGWEARISLPPGCVRFASEESGVPVFPDEPKRAIVYGISYPRQAVQDNLSLRFQDGLVRNTGTEGFNIGLMHANVGVNTGHDNYAPCSIDDLVSTDIDYWALGHVHTRQIMREEHPAIVYPGNPQGRHSKEPGKRGVYLGEVGDFGLLRLEFREVDVVRWETLSLDIAKLNTDQDLLNAIEQTTEECVEGADRRNVVYRLVLTGRGPLHGNLRKPGTTNDLMEWINEQYANYIPWIWCERILSDTGSPLDRQSVAQRDDFAGDLVRLSGDLVEDADAMYELQGLLQTLYVNSKAAPFLKNDLPADDELRGLVAASEDLCLTELVDEEDEG